MSHNTIFEPRTRENSYDHGTIVGAICAFGLVLIGIYVGGNLSAFFDWSSLLIVLGGTIGATLINFPLKDFYYSAPALKTAFFEDNSSPQDRIEKIIEIARRYRKEGHLSLQNDIMYETDPFLRKCLELAVDDLPPEEIKRILEIELGFTEDRHHQTARLFQTMGAVAPAMGLIGTLIGLVQMLQHLDDPSLIGPSMALALLTTFYGAILANLVFIPLAGKLLRRSEEESLIRQLTIEGIIEMLNRTNPRLVEQRLMGFIPPNERMSQFG